MYLLSTLKLEEHLNQLEILYGQVRRNQRALNEKGTPTNFSKALLGFSSMVFVILSV